MNRILIALASVLLLGLPVFCYAQDSGSQLPQSQVSTQHSRVLNQEEQKHPEAAPQQQQPETAPPPQKPEEEKPARPEKEEKPQEQPKAGHEEHGKTGGEAHARPAGKSAHIPDPKFKASFGRQHTFKATQVITTTTIVPNQTQFIFAGYTFIFLDPWPAGWLLTDDCFIDFVGDEYVLVDAFHPGVTVALFVVG